MCERETKKNNYLLLVLVDNLRKLRKICLNVNDNKKGNNFFFLH